MANLKLKVKDGKFNTNGEWVNAWDPSIDLGYPEDRLKDLPSGVKKIKITHPNKTITYVPFASDGNEYWEKKTHGTIQVQTCHLTIDGKYPLKLREYIKFRIYYNLGPNINGSGVDSYGYGYGYPCWNNDRAFAYTMNISSSISNPEDYYILLIGHGIRKIDESVGNEKMILIMSPLSIGRVSDNWGPYWTSYSIIGDDGKHATQWCDGLEAADWAGDTAKIYWFLVNNLKKLDTNHSLEIRTPHCDPHKRAETHEDFITSTTTGTPEHHGIVSYATRSAGMSLIWHSGLYYTKFFFDENGNFKLGGAYSWSHHQGNTPSIDVWMSTNATFDIVESGEVTLSCTKKRKKIGSESRQTGTDEYGNPIYNTVFYVKEGEDQTAAYSNYIYIYL